MGRGPQIFPPTTCSRCSVQVLVKIVERADFRVAFQHHVYRMRLLAYTFLELAVRSSCCLPLLQENQTTQLAISSPRLAWFARHSSQPYCTMADLARSNHQVSAFHARSHCQPSNSARWTSNSTFTGQQHHLCDAAGLSNPRQI